MKTTLVLAVCAATLGGVLHCAHAAPISFADNLECRDIKDMATRQLYSADFGSNELGRQDGCKVRLPAKQVCWAVLNDGLSPPGYAAPSGPNLNGQYYLCYEMVCPRDGTSYILADKLGGGRFVTLKRAKRVCVPGY